MTKTAEPAHLMAILSETVAGLDQCVHALSSSFPLPRRTVIGGRYLFRHLETSDLLVQFLKLVKVASHNNAAIILLRGGYVQEVYAICRMIDEACEDVHHRAASWRWGHLPLSGVRRHARSHVRSDVRVIDPRRPAVTAHQ